jgi:N-methylhydantoinase A/oxoprolinase/acetone carboxylase beta subunit
MSTPNCVIGIDTGGTYTDAVVLDRTSGRVLAA